MTMCYLGVVPLEYQYLTHLPLPQLVVYCYHIHPRDLSLVLTELDLLLMLWSTLSVQPHSGVQGCRLWYRDVILLVDSYRCLTYIILLLDTTTDACCRTDGVTASAYRWPNEQVEGRHWHCPRWGVTPCSQLAYSYYVSLLSHIGLTLPGNCRVFNEMLNVATTTPSEMTPDATELMKELNRTCRQMQQRIVVLIEQLMDDQVPTIPSLISSFLSPQRPLHAQHPQHPEHHLHSLHNL